MTFQHRCRHNIMADVLKLCRTPQTITHVYYRCNLTSYLAQKYLEYLQHRDLLRRGGRHYLTTDRGVTYLIKYCDVMDFLGDDKFFEF